MLSRYHFVVSVSPGYPTHGLDWMVRKNGRLQLRKGLFEFDRGPLI